MVSHDSLNDYFSRCTCVRMSNTPTERFVLSCGGHNAKLNRFYLLLLARICPPTTTYINQTILLILAARRDYLVQTKLTSLWVAKSPTSTSYNSLFKGLSTARIFLAQANMAPQSNPTGFEMKEFVTASTSKKWRAKDPWARA